MPANDTPSDAEPTLSLAELEWQSCVLQLMRLTGMPYEAVDVGLRAALEVSSHGFPAVTDQLVHEILRARGVASPTATNAVESLALSPPASSGRPATIRDGTKTG
jgi:hypothetical protein